MALDTQEVYETLTFRVRTPDGTMFVIVLEDDNGKPAGVHINIGKAGTSVSAWANATAILITRLFEAGVGVNEIIKELSELTSEKMVLSGDERVPIRSGPDGLSYALMSYRRMKFREFVGVLEGDEDTFRAPQMTGR